MSLLRLFFIIVASIAATAKYAGKGKAENPPHHAAKLLLNGLRIAFLLFATQGCIVHSQAWPSRPITLVVPFPPGAATDMVARTVGGAMTRTVGQPVIVDNRPGAGGAIGTQSVAKGPADGHLLGLINESHAAAAALMSPMPYRIPGDFQYVSLLGTAPHVLVASSRISSVAQLIASARASGVEVGNPGAGGSAHLALAVIGQRNKLKFMHVPYKGNGPMLTDISAGHMDYGIVAAGFIFPPAVKAIAVTGPVRSATYPNVPTLSESGLADAELTGFYGIVVPQATPQALVGQLRAAIQRALNDSSVTDTLRTLGITAADTASASLESMVQAGVLRSINGAREVGLLATEPKPGDSMMQWAASGSNTGSRETVSRATSPPAPSAAASAATPATATKPHAEPPSVRTEVAVTAPRRSFDTKTKSTKQEFLACRGAILRSCFAPTQCTDKNQKAPCMKVQESCKFRVLYEGNGEIAAMGLTQSNSGGAWSWSPGEVIDSDDVIGFRAVTWEDVRKMPDAGNSCESRYEAQAFMELLGTAAEKKAFGIRDSMSASAAAVATSASAGTGSSPVAASAPASGAMSTQRIESCNEDIKSKQRESLRWSGTVNQIAAQLGRYQKALFEGACAGHPEAQTYIASANKMIADGSAAPAAPTATSKMSASVIKDCDDRLEEFRKRAMAGSESEETKRRNLGLAQQNLFSLFCASHPDAAARMAEAKEMIAGRAAGGNGAASGTRLAPLKPGPKIAEHNPVHDATSCIKLYRGRAEIEAAGLRTTHSNLFVNSCNYSISLTWCVAADAKGNSGDCNPGYSNVWDLGAKAQWGIGGAGTVHYGACRHNRERGWGFQPIEEDPRNPFRYSCS